MDNQNNNVIKPSINVNGEEVKQENNVNTNKPKKKFNPIVVVIALVVVIGFIGGYFFLNGNSSSGPTKKEEKQDEKITFDTDYDWANKYGEYLNDYFENFDKIDIAFAELNSNTSGPELIVRYTDRDVEMSDILYLKNNEVFKTRQYSNAKFYLITPVTLEQVEWYLYIGDNRFGKYTIASQLIDGTALDATIKATNEDEVSQYNKDYVHSKYELVFYEIEKGTFKDDYLTKVKRYEDDRNNEDEAIRTLKEDRLKYISDNNIDISSATLLKVNNYTLEFGIYLGNIYSSTDGNIESTTDNLVLNALDGLIYKGENHKFTVAGNTLTLDDGTVFTAIGNNQLQTVVENVGPVIYKIPEPGDNQVNSNLTN